MTTVLQYLVIAGVIGLVVFGIAVLVFGRGEQLAPLSPRISPTELPDLDITGGDVEKVRFAMAVRGYRMSDVDWAMRRLGAEIDRLRTELDRAAGGDRAVADRTIRAPSSRVFAAVTPAESPPGRAGEDRGHRPRSDRMSVRVEASVDVPVDAATAFAAVVDLPSQERWIMLTRLYALEGDVPVPRVGSRFLAVHRRRQRRLPGQPGVTEYDPPHRWVARHEGEFVKGAGIMQVEPLGEGSRVTFTEELELPFGILGRLGWPLARPIARWGMAASLRTMARLVAAGTLPLSREVARPPRCRHPVGSGMRAVPHGAMRRGRWRFSLLAPGADRTASIPGRLDHRHPGTIAAAPFGRPVRALRDDGDGRQQRIRLRRQRPGWRGSATPRLGRRRIDGRLRSGTLRAGAARVPPPRCGLHTLVMQALSAGDVDGPRAARPSRSQAGLRYRPFRVRVSRVERLSPAFWQVTFAGPDVADFGTEGLDQRIKLLLPDPDADSRAPDHGIDDPPRRRGDWYARWLAVPDAARPAMRTYTVRRVRPSANEVDVVLVEHAVAPGAEHGPAGRWLQAVTAAGSADAGARASSPLDEVIVIGPDARSAERGSGIDWRPGEANRVLLVGDETRGAGHRGDPGGAARPAGHRVRRGARRPPTCCRLTSVRNARITWIERGGGVHGSRLLPAVTAWLDSHDGLLEGARAVAPQVVEDTDVDVELIWDSPEAPHAGFYAWIAGEAAAVKALRRAVVTDRGVDRRQVAFMGYWRQGQAERP